MSPPYLLITPCRDEAEHLLRTIDCVAAQSPRPACWVIVDDGSSDATPQILADAAKQHPFIRVVTREDRGERAVGQGVVEAFYAGLESVDLDEYSYLCKLDADLEVPRCYFERVIESFEQDAYLGAYSGKVYTRHGQQLISERIGDENAVGAAKFYRVQCFRDIGGFVRRAGWDGLDGHMCRRKGWVARSEDRPELRLVQARPMGTSQTSLWQGRLRWGRGKYYMGSALYYVMAASLYRMLQRPFLVGGLGILWGYLGSMGRRSERLNDPALRRVLRSFELQCLLLGRRRTISKFNDRVRATFPPPPERMRAVSSFVRPPGLAEFGDVATGTGSR